MQVLQQRCKKMYDKGYTGLILFRDGTAAIFIKPEIEDKDLPSQNILRHLTILEDGTLI